MQTKKVTFIGGGSYQWVPLLFRDIAVNPHLQNIRFVLHDLDTERNDELAAVCRTISLKVGSGIHVDTEENLERSIEGADAVILCISTGGLEAMEHDIEIPKKYGIYQPVGDSTGPGGISRTLRNVPVVADLAGKMEQLCPDAWLLNLSNPMGQIVRTVHKTSKIKVVGLCHEFMCFMDTVQRIFELQNWKQQTSSTIVGINHFAWITRLNINGECGLERLSDFRSNPAGFHSANKSSNVVNQSNSQAANQVKFMLFETYGAMPYPGDRHLVEFFPYFISKKTNHGADFGVSLTSIEDRRTNWMRAFKERISEWTGERIDSVPLKPSDESLAPILAALLGDGPLTIQPATLPNSGQAENLPEGSSVETLATFGHGMMSPHASGKLPPALLTLIHKHCLNQDLTVDGALEGDRSKVLHAMLADPLNNNNDYREIARMLDELIAANAKLLPQFSAPMIKANGRHKIITRSELKVEPFSVGNSLKKQSFVS